MTTITETTIGGLRDRLAECEREVEEAERAVGSAALDGKPSPPGASKRLREAREHRERLERAIEEAGRREADGAERAAMATAARERGATYRALAEWFTVAARTIGAHEEARAAYEQLREIRLPRRVYRLRAGMPVPWVPGCPVEPFEGRRLLQDGEHELADALVRSSSRPPKLDVERREALRPLGRLTVERCRELAERAEQLAVEADTEADHIGR
ncbi:MAG: hypothetical protein WD399_08055 [Thermoleophilaceae bacterium]